MNVEHDTERRRFVTRIEGEEAYLRYEPLDERVLDYESTFVPPPLRHRGIATALVRHALDYARARGLSVRPTCWFVRDVMQRFPEYAEIGEAGRGKREG